jgi:hypothetical protein
VGRITGTHTANPTHRISGRAVAASRATAHFPSGWEIPRIADPKYDLCDPLTRHSISSRATLPFSFIEFVGKESNFINKGDNPNEC